MERACNIDAKGKAVRLLSGVCTLIAGLVLLGVAIAGIVSTWWFWALAVAAIVGGGFQIYEGWCGWCIVRAFGYNPPI